MRYILAIIIPIIFYFGIGWITKDIYFSIWEVTSTTTIQDIYNKEIFLYGCVAIAYIFICWLIVEDAAPLSVISLMIFAGALPISGYVLCAFILPISQGAMILNTILCIIGLILASLIVVAKYFEEKQ